MIGEFVFWACAI